MADIIAMFSRWTKSSLSALLLDLLGRGKNSSSLDGSSSSSSSSSEATRRSALDDFQRIMRMLPRIEAVLEDAEEREIQDTSVKLWLSELRLLAYDIDDVIDEYENDVLAAKMEATATEDPYQRGKRKRGNDEHHDEVKKRDGQNILASSSSQVPAIFDAMAKKLREIRERFDEIQRDRNSLHLREEDGVRRTDSAQNPRLTSSLVDVSSIIGRESEKEEIVKLLLLDLEFDSNIPVSNKITVIPIVGMGGVGKTTLAQVIYNDPRIDEYFDLRIWIYVSEDFDLVKLTKEIYRFVTKKSCPEDFGLNYYQKAIKKQLMKFKRTFLVLDDMWNEKQCLWESLIAPFHGVGTVNILLTTRNEKVADVMRTTNIFQLSILSKEQGWCLFQQCALLCADDNLVMIGKRIVNKCGGLPLVIKLLGSHLRFERDEEKWMSILKSELWDLDLGKNEIFPALKLSYQRMPSHLKPCFRYCSIFPKNKMPDKKHLVWLWMAQGYIQPKIRGKTMEEIGREYFDELLGRSLFQATETTDYFKMHDLVYELAVLISDSEFFIMKSEGGKQNKCISNNVHHLGVYDQSTNNEALKDTLVHQFRTRQAAPRSIFYYSKLMIRDFYFLDSIRLRAVHLNGIFLASKLLNILDSIASLKHLRYIYIRKWNVSSTNDYSTLDVPSRLFNSLHGFRNALVLELDGFHQPIMLPESIKNLTNLRHLILPFGSTMPCGISKLTGLQTLKFVAVEDGNPKGGGLGEIEDLESLTGSCCIECIDYAHNVEDFKKANINRKKHIWKLCIAWNNMRDFHKAHSFDVGISFAKTIRVQKQNFEVEEVKLEALRPHNNLKELGIYSYPGIQFPLWLGNPSYSKLQDITLRECNEWDGSGRVLDRDLPCLQSISIINCAKLKSIKIVQSSSLSTLHIENCPVITTLHGLCSLHGLEKLEIIRCYNLLISLEEILPSKLQYVCFKDCWKLTSVTGLENLRSLEELKLIRCPKVKLSLEQQLSSMPRVLEIVDCPGLEEWCQIYGFKIIQELSKKEELTINDTSNIISHYGSGNLISLKNLHIVGSQESDFPKVEWISCSLHTLHLISCRRLMFFPPYQNLSTLRMLKIWSCTALTCLLGLEMMESLKNLEIIDCPQFALSPNYNLPPKLQFLLVSSCPSLLRLPGLEQLFSLRDLKLFECSKLMLPPPEQLPFMHHVRLELFNSPKLIDWCQRYDVSYNNKESPNDIFVRNGEQIKLWLEESYEFFENICVLDYDGAILEIKKLHIFLIVGFYICSCVHLKIIIFEKNFTRLKQLRIWDCSHLEKLDGLQYVTTLQDMDISNCPNVESLFITESLKYLAIDRCNKLYKVYCWRSNLSTLEISSCSTLFLISGVKKHASLHFLKIDNCPRLCLKYELLPDMLNPNNVKISACPLLQEWCQDQDVAYYTEEG